MLVMSQIVLYESFWPLIDEVGQCIPNLNFLRPLALGDGSASMPSMERFKRSLAGLPTRERDPKEPIRFVDASDVCKDLGIDRRTLGRRIRGHIRGDEGEGASQ
jgi:hypothetical protein